MTEENGIEWKKLTVADLGEGNITERIEKDLNELAKMLGNTEVYGVTGKASIVLRIELMRDDTTVGILAALKVTPPAPIKKRTFAYFTKDGELKVQRAEQLSIESIKRAQAEREGKV